MNTADTRLWRCPECGEVERISIQIEDPMICSDCMLNVSERNQDTKKEKPVDLIFDDEKKSFLSNLPPKVKVAGICVAFFGALYFLGMISDYLEPDDDTLPSIQYAARSTDRNSRQPRTTQTLKWYVGGTLHEKSALEWQKANYSDKLATCADFVSGTWDMGRFKPNIQNSIVNVPDDLKPLAAELVKYINAATKAVRDPAMNKKAFAGVEVATIAAIGMKAMGWVD